ncbi:hypothetical protein MRX96_050429 [Rhipicephalus microplus]
MDRLLRLLVNRFRCAVQVNSRRPGTRVGPSMHLNIVACNPCGFLQTSSDDEPSHVYRTAMTSAPRMKTKCTGHLRAVGIEDFRGNGEYGAT